MKLKTLAITTLAAFLALATATETFSAPPQRKARKSPAKTSATAKKASGSAVDIDKVADFLGGIINDKGIGQYRLGANPAQLGLDDGPQKYSSYRWAAIKELNDGPGYHMGARFDDLDSDLASYKNVNDGNGHFSVEYSFNPESTIDQVSLWFYTKGTIYKQLVERLIPQLETKGWTIETRKPAYCVMRSGSDYLLVVPNYFYNAFKNQKSTGIDLYIVTSNYWTSFVKPKVQVGINNYQRFNSDDPGENLYK